jgi:hypothetical protein
MAGAHVRDSRHRNGAVWCDCLGNGANPLAALDRTKPRDPAIEQQTMHFISHINASCFISVLQILDPLPGDYQAQAEYRRFYRQLHEGLETPPPPRVA